MTCIYLSHARYELKTEDMPTGKRSIIQIQSVQAGDFGIYNCSVENGYGHDFKTITFYKQGMDVQD